MSSLTSDPRHLMPPLLHNLPAETADEVLSFLEPRDLYSLMALSSADRAHYRTPYFFRLVVLYTLHDCARALSCAPRPLSDEDIAAMSFDELLTAVVARGIDVKDKPAKPDAYYWSVEAGELHDDAEILAEPITLTSSQKRAIPSPFSSSPVLAAILKKWSETNSESDGSGNAARSRPSFSSCHRSCAAPVLGLSSVSLSSPIWEHAAEFLMMNGEEYEWQDEYDEYDEYIKDMCAALSRCFKLTLCDALTNQHAGGAFLLPWAGLVPKRAAPKGALFDGPGLCLPMPGVTLPTYLDSAAIKLLHDAATPVRADGNRYSSLAPPLFSITSSSWQHSVTDDSLTSVLGAVTQTIAPHVYLSDVYAITSQIIILQEGDSITSFSPATASAPSALATLFVDLPTDCIDCIGQHTTNLCSTKLPSLPALQGGDLLATGDQARVCGKSIRADGSAATTKSLARSRGCPVLAQGRLATDPNEAHGTLFSWLAVAGGQPIAVTPVSSGCKVILVFTLHHKDPLKITHQPRPPPIAYGDAVPVLHHLLPIGCGTFTQRRTHVSINYMHTGHQHARASINWGDANAMRAADPVTLFRMDAYTYDDDRPDICFLAPSLSLPKLVTNNNVSTFALDSSNGLLRGKDLALFELLEDAIGGQARRGDGAAKMAGWIVERTLLTEDTDRYIPSTNSGLSVVGSRAVARDWNEGDARVDWGILEEDWCSYSDMEREYDLIIEVNASVADTLRSTKPETVNEGYGETWLIEVRKVPTITVQMRRD